MVDNFFNKEDKILIASIQDKYRKYIKTGISTYTNFINEIKLDKIRKYLDNQKIIYNVYKPYHFLDKSIIYFGEYDNYVTIYKSMITNEIKHSDILGKLFSIGIDNDLIGDIIVEDGYFYYTNLTRLNSYLESELTTIKNEVIKLEKVDSIVLNKEHTKSFEIIVSSMRIDNIISKIVPTSRSKALDMIKDKMILLNLEEIRNDSTILKENDVLSIRKYGKYKIGKSKNLSKKKNIILEIIKYI